MPAHAAHVGETEAFDAGVVVGVAGAVVAAGDGVWAELHQTKWHGRTRKSFAFTKLSACARTDHGIDRIHQRFGGGVQGQ